MNQLNEVFQTNGTVNYFNFCAAIEEMLKTHHLMQTSDKKLSITKLGFDTAELFQKNLPYSTVKKTLRTLKQINERDRMSKNAKTSIEKRKDGFGAKLTLEETGTDMISLEIFCGSENEAKIFEQELKNKTVEIYKTIVAMLNNDFGDLKKTIKELEEKYKKTKK